MQRHQRFLSLRLEDFADPEASAEDMAAAMLERYHEERLRVIRDFLACGHRLEQIEIDAPVFTADPDDLNLIHVRGGVRVREMAV